MAHTENDILTDLNVDELFEELIQEGFGDKKTGDDDMDANNSLVSDKEIEKMLINIKKTK